MLAFLAVSAHPMCESSQRLTALTSMSVLATPLPPLVLLLSDQEAPFQ